MTTPDQQLYRLRDVMWNQQDISDLYLTFHWANDILAREMSFNQELIPLEQHSKWFYNRLTEGNWWILEEFKGYGDVVPIGQIRFDRRVGQLGKYGAVSKLFEHFIVSIFVAPEWRGKGYATDLLRLGLARVESRRQKLPCVAYIKKENRASTFLFSRAGFGPRFTIGGRDYSTVDGNRENNDYITLVRYCD